MKKSLLLLSFIFVTSVSAQTKDVELYTPTPSYPSIAHVDILAGLTIPTGDQMDNVDSRFGMGAQLLFDATSAFSIGAYYNTSNGEINNTNVDMRLSYYGVVAQYKMTPMFYSQFKAGFSTISVDGGSTTVTIDENPFTISAGLGLELPISGMFSFAPYASYTHSFEKDTVDSYGLVDIMASLRFKF